MPDAPHSNAAAPSGLLGRLRSGLQPARERITGGIASTLNGVLSAVGLKLEIEAAPPGPDAAAPARPQVVQPPQTRVPVSPISPISPLPTMFPVPAVPVAAPARPLAPLAQPYSLAPAPAPAPPRGPTQVQVMTAVQRAVSGAVKVVSGTVDGVRAAGAAARAASTTATGAGAVASGVATVASGFFPQLAALGIGVPKAPKNRPGMRPQRRVADIIANPMGRAPQQAAAPGEPPRPVRRVQRLPMVRPKSSLALSRNENKPKLRTYSDLQMRPQIGLTPHEILLKVATITLGKTLLGFLEAGARSQQQALQRVGARMSEKQIMLLGMLPAQYIAMRLPPTPVEAPPTPSARPSSDPASPAQPSASSSASGAFKIRY